MAFPQARVVTLSEAGTHAVVDARIGGLNCGELELARPLAAAALGMLVVMDRNFAVLDVWQVFTGAGAHLLIRTKSPVARTVVEQLPDGSYLARVTSLGRNGVRTRRVVVCVVEYQVDDGETIRLLTDLLDPEAAPAGELAELYHQRWEAELSNRQIKTSQRGPPGDSAVCPLTWCARRSGPT